MQNKELKFIDSKILKRKEIIELYKQKIEELEEDLEHFKKLKESYKNG